MSQKTPAPAASSTFEAVNDAKTNAWNKHISQKIESVRDWLKADPGVMVYLEQHMQVLVDALIRGCKTRDDDQFARGRIAMLRELLHLPAAVEAQIKAKEHNESVQNESKPNW